MRVEFHSEARAEFRELKQHAPAEYRAMRTAIAILEAAGPDVSSQYSSQVKGTKLRELRPRAGHSPWRAFYSRFGDVLRIGAIGPEAKVDRHGFERAVDLAITRLGM